MAQREERNAIWVKQKGKRDSAGGKGARTTGEGRASAGGRESHGDPEKARRGQRPIERATENEKGGEGRQDRRRGGGRGRGQRETFHESSETGVQVLVRGQDRSLGEKGLRWKKGKRTTEPVGERETLRRQIGRESETKGETKVQGV